MAIKTNKGDLISRSALLERLDKVAMPDDLYGLGMQRGVERAKEVIAEAPAVDAETVFEAAGLVKEAFDMANADLVPVVRCKDCKAWNTKTAMSFLRDGVHVRCCTCSACGRLMHDDDFCSYGKRR